jgi:hypothetical protein
VGQVLIGVIGGLMVVIIVAFVVAIYSLWKSLHG